MAEAMSGEGHGVIAQVPPDQDRSQHRVDRLFDRGVGLAGYPRRPHHLGATR